MAAALRDETVAFDDSELRAIQSFISDGAGSAFFGRDAWAWPVAERYADDLGIDAGLLPPLLSVACARVVAATGPPNGGPANSARDAAARHFALWRRVLELA